MAAAIDLRSGCSADESRRLAREGTDARQARRLLALAGMDDGASRTMAARDGGVGLRIVRDWVVRFSAEGPAGLGDRQAPGKAPRLAPERRAALGRKVEAGPKPHRDGVVRWRLADRAARLREGFGVAVGETTVSRALGRMGLRGLTARPQAHGQEVPVIEAFERDLPAVAAGIRERRAAGGRIEVWWQDEARIGQKDLITRRGTRPRAPHE